MVDRREVAASTEMNWRGEGSSRREFGWKTCEPTFIFTKNYTLSITHLSSNY